jgi:hypothetical protein
VTSPQQAPPANPRRVIHGTCTLHRCPLGFTNLVVTKHDQIIEIDPHVTGACVIRLEQHEARALRDALTQWLA